MRWLGKFFVTLLFVLILAIIVIYVVAQTHWGAKQLSQWLNRQGHYQVSIESISHSWLQPATLTFNHVDIRDKQSPFSLNTDTINLDFKWQHLLSPNNLRRLTLQNGTLILSGNAFPLPLQADILQLNQMNIQLEKPNTHIQGENITGGIAPWVPAVANPLGSGKYQFSAGTLRLNDIPLENVIMQGSVQNKALTIDSFGATFLRGAISGDGQRLPDGSWRWNNILISDIRWQTPMTLGELKEKISHFPASYVKDLNITNAKLQGADWSVDYLDSTIKNVGWVNGSWRADEGLIDFNAMNMTLKNAQFNDTLGKLRFSGDTFTIANLTTHYQKGLFNIQSQWDRKNRLLTLQEGSVTGLLYALPPAWLDYFKKPAPQWISGLKLNDMTINNTLLIDTNPHFPFQLTTLAAHIDNMDILKNGKWGLWNGQASLQAAGGTFNKVEITRPYLQLHATDGNITLDKLNGFTDEGLLQLTGSVEQQTAHTPFNLNFKGMNADLNILPQWGWVPLKVQGEGNFSLAITGDLWADDVKGTINGTLVAEDKSAGKESQSIEQGLISTNRCDPTAPSAVENPEADHATTGNLPTESQTCAKIRL
ncbi:AsmA family protein [Xenorhabdus sp. DI]|uniref:AsmA family protein n=1 Tax=Xenorhabdus doucetiae TaxID=351671 RepID=UPI0019BF462E|nr:MULTISPECIES: AsmA family protein [unclassified Xenorhabdus]MBD2783776.1 AsmA family protein [Xenorhabdus sp. 3]MBD2788210.1 AsmA family protein [Xenorhabdus sp. DI]